jgi:hypothetical protein
VVLSKGSGSVSLPSLLLLLLLAGLGVASLAQASVAAETTEASKPGVTNVNVMLGRSSEYAITLTVPGHAKAGTGLLDVGQNAYGGEKLALAQKVTQCMHSHGFPNYPDNGNFTGTGSKPSTRQANAAEKNCETRARKALGLP